ncbi:MAG: hypothetical protein EXR27_12115 [Betaproteobacteria bacterium]|nr:hypothetical protein [Betaproteobacteria bacterium]
MITSRIVPARNGWSWITRGFALFRSNVPMWIALVFLYWLLIALVNQLQAVGTVLATISLPAFSVSFMIICGELERGGRVRPSMLFAGFRRALPALIMLGGLYLVSILLLLGISSLADDGALMKWVLSGKAPGNEQLRDGSVTRAMLLAGAIGTPVLSAFWFAPVLVSWGEMTPGKALFYSFFATLRNWRAFTLYGAMLGLLAVMLTLVLAVFAIVSGGNIEVVRLSGLLLTVLGMPTLFASFFVCYRDIFPPVPASGLPAEPPHAA